MTNADQNAPEPLPQQIAAEAERERAIHRGSTILLHRWWARRSAVLARVATYLAITQERTPTPEFLESLGKVDLLSATLKEACLRIRDTAWHWSLREWQQQSAVLTEPPPAPDALRILDPFAGSGAIPFEAARLGCSAYAGDLSPVSYIILRGLLEYPQRYGPRDAAVPGSGQDGRWSGLAAEIRTWTVRLNERVRPRLTSLFPEAPGKGRGTPDRYIWFRQVQCPKCRIVSPLQIDFPLDAKDDPHLAQAGMRARGKWNCRSCGLTVGLAGLPINEPALLAAVRLSVSGRPSVVPVQQADLEAYAPWTTDHADRLNILFNKDLGRQINSPLPREAYRSFLGHKAATFRDLFSPRQLLVALEYVNGIHEIIAEMRHAEMPSEHMEALATYLALFIGYLVDWNSMLCRWNPIRCNSGASFDRPAAFFSNVFVERSPVGMDEEWLAKIAPVIESKSPTGPQANVYLGDACNLPFANDFFDAVVTDPPYYDNIPYSELTDFFWIWESAALAGLAFPSRFAQSPDDYIESKGSNKTEPYRQKALVAFKEVFRVLKPGRRLCLFLFVRSSKSFQEYVNLCQEAGFELVDVRSLPESLSRLGNNAGQTTFVTYLIYLRKPTEKPTRVPLQATDAAALLEAADAGRPVMYAALADLINRELSEEDVAELLPQNARGNRLEQLMEVVAEHDPRELLERCFGRAGVRSLACKISSPSKIQASSPIEILLVHFGFAIPSPTKGLVAVTQVRDQLRKLANRVILAADRSDATGPFLDGCTAVEKLLKLSIWGWASLLFGNTFEEHLLAILREDAGDSERRFDLKRLSFGDVIALFRRLPDHVAPLPEAAAIERKFGRKHAYLPRDRKTRFAERLKEVVAFRNKVEHNKDNYKDSTPINQLREDLAGLLTRAAQLLGELADAHAVPQVAEPFQEIRDKWGRTTYKLSMDDGTDVEARFSGPLNLGCTYLYFGTDVNPKPVDPLVIAVDDLGEIP